MSSSEVRLTTDGTFKQDPVFVRADEVVFTLLESPVQTRLLRLKLGEKSATKLHPEAVTSEFEATFTASGDTYAFVQSRGNLNLKLVIREAGTGKDAVFDPGGGFAGVRRPSFHPAGEQVCFGIPTATGQEIASVGRDGKDRKTLTSGGVNNWPAYSPDGKKIAFCSSRDGTLALFVMNADGTGAARVGKLDGMQLRPSWAPDGKRLCFTWNRDGVYALHTINADGTGLVRLTDGTERSDYVTWAADGKSVVFVGERKGKFDLYRIDVK
jgi:hypothetical protein